MYLILKDYYYFFLLFYHIRNNYRTLKNFLLHIYLLQLQKNLLDQLEYIDDINMNYIDFEDDIIQYPNQAKYHENLSIKKQEI